MDDGSEVGVDPRRLGDEAWELGISLPDDVERLSPRRDDSSDRRLRTVEYWDELYGDKIKMEESSTFLRVQEFGIAQSRDDDFGSAWMGVKQRRKVRNRGVPNGLVELVRRQTHVNEEEQTVEATQSHVGAAYQTSMQRALAGKTSAAKAPDKAHAADSAQGRLTKDVVSVSMSLKEAEKVEESTGKWFDKRPSKQGTRRTRVELKTFADWESMDDGHSTREHNLTD